MGLTVGEIVEGVAARALAAIAPCNLNFERGGNNKRRAHLAQCICLVVCSREPHRYVWHLCPWVRHIAHVGHPCWGSTGVVICCVPISIFNLLGGRAAVCHGGGSSALGAGGASGVGVGSGWPES